jgi:hypothetical protein
MGKRGCAVLIALGALAGAGVAFYLWRAGSLSQSPARVVTDTLQLANAGQYEAANANLLSKLQNVYDTEHGLRDATWGTITRGSSIRDIEILKQTIGANAATVVFAIRYQNGERREAEETCELERGEWRLSFGGTVKSLASDFDVWNTKNHKLVRVAVSGYKVALEDSPTVVPGTHVRIRLPPNCPWDATRKCFVRDDMHFEVHPFERDDLGFAARINVAHSNWQIWDAAAVKLLGEKEITVNGRRAQRLDGDAMAHNGEPWRLIAIVLGTDDKSVLIEGRTPPVPRHIQLLEECLMSTQWQP